MPGLIDFPNNPSLSQVYVFNDKSWIWNGLGWQSGTGPIAPPYPNVTIDFTNNLFLSANSGGVIDEGPVFNYVNFQRASSATNVMSDGTIDYAPNNLLLWSNKFDETSYWLQDTCTAVVNGVAPNGLDAWEVTLTGDSGLLFTQNGVLETNTSSCRVSFYCKMGAGTDEELYFSAYSFPTFTNNDIIFNMVTGSIVSYGQPNADPLVENAGGGWWKVSFTAFNSISEVTMFPNADLAGSGFFISSIQLDQTFKSVNRPYNLTTSSPYQGPRIDYNPSTLDCLGLLIEQQGTNLVTSSGSMDDGNYELYNVSMTPNASISPTGTTNASKITPTATASFHLNRCSLNYGSGGSYTYSVYVKAAGYSQVALRESWNTGGAAIFNLDTGTVAGTYVGTGAGDTGTPSNATIQSLPNGWYRISFTCTTTFTSQGWGILVLDGTWTSGDPLSISWSGDGTSGIYVWGAQQEAYSTLTSIIPTTTATATRNQDTAQMTGTNVTSWYNEPAGTFVCDFMYKNIISTSILMTIDGTGGVAALIDYMSAFGDFRFYYSSIGASISAGSFSLNNTLGKMAGAYQINDFATVLNGGTVGTITSGAVLTGVDRLTIGSAQDFSYGIDGHIPQIFYYNTRLSDASLQSITA